MRIDTEQTPVGWQAIDLDTYDGAPDSGPQFVGWGKTEQEAIDDLLEAIAEAAA